MDGWMDGEGTYSCGLFGMLRFGDEAVISYCSFAG